MDLVELKLVTIISEPVLEDELVTAIREKGSKGYTLSYAEGEGTRGLRASEWAGQNVRIETLVSKEVAERILEHLAGRYFTDYAVVAYVENVSVVRGDKYI